MSTNGQAESSGEGPAMLAGWGRLAKPGREVFAVGTAQPAAQHRSLGGLFQVQDPFNHLVQLPTVPVAGKSFYFLCQGFYIQRVPGIPFGVIHLP